MSPTSSVICKKYLHYCPWICCTRACGANPHLNDVFHKLWNKQLHNLLVNPLLHAFSWDQLHHLNHFQTRGHVPCKVYRGSKGVRMCVSFLLTMRLACVSVYLRIGGVRRERFRPARIVRNRAGLQIYPLPLPWAGGKAEELRLECGLVALTKMATTVHHQSPIVQQMGDGCGFPKQQSTHCTTKNTQTNTQTPEGENNRGRGAHLFSALAELPQRVNMLFPLRGNGNPSRSD